MTNPIWEDNLRRMLKHCSRPLTEMDIEASVARFERRLEPKPKLGRVLLLVAAAASIILAVWIAGPWQRRPPSTDGSPGHSSQEKREKAQADVDRLIEQLGSERADLAEVAKAKLREIGRPALEPLDRAYYHENPNVRLLARPLSKEIRDAVSEQEALIAFEKRISIVRARWAARDFKDIEQVAREALGPDAVNYIHYVPKKEVGDHLEIMDRAFGGRDPLLYVPSHPLLEVPGQGDLLSRELAEALSRGTGLVFVRPTGVRTLDKAAVLELSSKPLGLVFILALPDHNGWSAYLVVELSRKVGTNRPFIRKIPTLAPPVIFGKVEVGIAGISMNWTYKDFTPQEVQKMAQSKERTDAARVTFFVVEREVNGSGKWEVIADKVDPKVTSWTDAQIKPKLKYTYRVKAYSTEGAFLDRGGKIDEDLGGTPNPSGLVNVATGPLVETR